MSITTNYTSNVSPGVSLENRASIHNEVWSHKLRCLLAVIGVITGIALVALGLYAPGAALVVVSTGVFFLEKAKIMSLQTKFSNLS